MTGRPLRVGVIGAGISGLAAAHHLASLARRDNQPLDLRLWEAGPRPGGIIQTQNRDGFLWEEGPDSFITEKPWALDLCKALGLEEELIGTDPRHQKSYVFFGGRLHSTPEGFYLLAPAKLWPLAASSLFSWPGKVRMAADFFIPPRPAIPQSDESLASFVRRRLGQEALERMAQPMVAGIYSADPENLSLRATFPSFLDMETRHGSVIRGLMARRRDRGMSKGVSGPRYGLFATLRRGLSSLVDALVKSLPPGALRLRTPVAAVSRWEGHWRVALAAGGTDECDALCMALPAPSAAKILSGLDPDMTETLNSIPYAPSAALHAAFPRGAVKHPLDAFGFVVPSVENRSIAGCSFSSVKFPGRAPEGFVLLRAFLDVRLLSEPSLDEAALMQRALDDLRAILGVSGAPLFTSLARHAAAMPHYTLGHLERVAALDARLKSWPGLSLAGNGFRGLGLPDCVRSGRDAAESLWSRLSAAPFPA